jgi:hypothetical protein
METTNKLLLPDTGIYYRIKEEFKKGILKIEDKYDEDLDRYSLFLKRRRNNSYLGIISTFHSKLIGKNRNPIFSYDVYDKLKNPISRVNISYYVDGKFKGTIYVNKNYEDSFYDLKNLKKTNLFEIYEYGFKHSSEFLEDIISRSENKDKFKDGFNKVLFEYPNFEIPFRVYYFNEKLRDENN